MFWKTVVFYAKLIQGFLPLITAIIGIIGIYVFVQLSPKVQFNIVPRWINNKLVVLRLEVTNQSRVRIKKKELIQLQVLEYDLPCEKSMSEWVHLIRKKLKKQKVKENWKIVKNVKRPLKFLSQQNIYTRVKLFLSKESTF